MPEGQTCQPWSTHSSPFCAPTLAALTAALSDPTAAATELDTCLQIATDVLWNLTAKRYSGQCDDFIRPQAQWRQWSVPKWWPSPANSTTPWGWCSCHRPRQSGCSRLSEIRLPNGPVNPEGVVVKIDGATLDPDAYRIDDSRYLVRIDGDGWPCCQDLELADTEERTFSVAYVFGKNPPIGGVRACEVYGDQLALAMNPSAEGECRLPKNVVSVARQGVTTRFADPSMFAEKGLVGLASVDAWVMSVNQGGKRRRATVYFPGRSRGSRRTSH